jgi:hypothetical protein
VGEVGAENQRLDAQSLDLTPHALGGLRQEVQDGDLGALASEAQGDSAADAATAAGDERGPSP